MEKNLNEIEKKQIAILEKRLERSEHSRVLLEQAKDHYDVVYHSIIENWMNRRNCQIFEIRNSSFKIGNDYQK